MSNIKDFEEFARNYYELISERDSLKEEKQNKEISYLTFENSQTESEEDLEQRIALFNQKWNQYIEDCFKQSPFLFYLKYTIGINNIKDKEDRQKVEDYERKIVEYTELAARLYPELEGISKGKQKTLSR